MSDFPPTDRPYVIAEVGGNHGGDFETAVEYVRAAADAGVDAVKFQIYRAERLIQSDEPPLPLAGEEYETQYDRFKELELADGEWDDLISETERVGVDFAASAFDHESMRRVAEVSPFIKIASGDLTNVPLLREACGLDKPVLLSTGFATIAEINRAVNELSSSELTLLHCIGSYPTDDGDANMQMIDHLARRYELPVGYSDHTIGTLAPIVAMSKGAPIIEKHFTLDKSIDVGDHRLSATPEEMSEIMDAAARIARMETDLDRAESFDFEDDIRTKMRRSLATANTVSEGEKFHKGNLTALRPEKGVSPLRYDEVLGSRATRDFEARALLNELDFE
jgi:N,N'-diacetyllegionaminate synthase